MNGWTFELELALQSETLVASGLAEPGGADTDIEYDALGLPRIGGRRLKGLLRDAWRVIEGAGLTTVPAEDVFGVGGAQHSSWLRVGNGELTGAREVRDWLMALASANAPFGRDQWLDAITVVWSQTAVAHDTGSAETHTLRSVRALVPGLAFRAPLRVTRPNADKLRDLALAAAAIRTFGSQRNRGFGRVRCRLLAMPSEADPQQVYDLTAIALDPDKTKDWPEFSVEGEGTSPAAATRPPHSITAGQTGKTKAWIRFDYTLRLEEPVRIASAAGSDPNTGETLDYISGAAMHGALGARLVAAGWSRADLLRLRIGPAFIVCNGAAAVRVPFVWRREKSGQTVRTVDDDRGGVTTRITGYGRFDRVGQERKLHVAPVLREHRYHHQREADPRRQRPEDGKLFVYESLAPEQAFSGTIFVPGDMAEAFAEQVETLGEVELGNSRSAQYGRCRCDFRQVDEDWAAARARAHGLPLAEAKDEAVLFVADTPLLPWNTNGQIVARLDAETLVATWSAAGLDLPAIESVRAWTRSEVVGGFYGYLRMPAGRVTGLAAGSCAEVVFSTPLNAAQVAALHAAGMAGIGARAAQGFGRFLVLKPPVPGATFTVSVPESMAARSDAVPLSETVRGLIQPVLQRQSQRWGYKLGYDAGRRAPDKNASRSLRHRVRNQLLLVLRTAGKPSDVPAEMKTWLGSLKEKAAGVKKWRIHLPDEAGSKGSLEKVFEDKQLEDAVSSAHTAWLRAALACNGKVAEQLQATLRDVAIRAFLLGLADGIAAPQGTVR